MGDCKCALISELELCSRSNKMSGKKIQHRHGITRFPVGYYRCYHEEHILKTDKTSGVNVRKQLLGSSQGTQKWSFPEISFRFNFYLRTLIPFHVSVYFMLFYDSKGMCKLNIYACLYHHCFPIETNKGALQLRMYVAGHPSLSCGVLLVQQLFYVKRSTFLVFYL